MVRCRSSCCRHGFRPPDGWTCSDAVALGADDFRRYAGVDQRLGRSRDEGVRAADEGQHSAASAAAPAPASPLRCRCALNSRTDAVQPRASASAPARNRRGGRRGRSARRERSPRPRPAPKTSARPAPWICARSRWRTIAISGTTPEPPPTRSSGPPSPSDQTKCPPSGPRSSISSPTAATSWKKGETSPSSSFSIASSIVAPLSGAEAME